MNIRIESEHENLKELHQLIYEADSSIEIDEDYQSTPGMQREPVIIALIVALSPIVTTAIKSWIKDRKNKREAALKLAELNLEKEKALMLYDLAKTKLVLEFKDEKTIELNIDQVNDIDKYLSEKLTEPNGQ